MKLYSAQRNGSVGFKTSLPPHVPGGPTQNVRSGKGWKTHPEPTERPTPGHGHTPAHAPHQAAASSSALRGGERDQAGLRARQGLLAGGAKPHSTRVQCPANPLQRTHTLQPHSPLAGAHPSRRAGRDHSSRPRLSRHRPRRPHFRLAPERETAAHHAETSLGHSGLGLPPRRHQRAPRGLQPRHSS